MKDWVSISDVQLKIFVKLRSRPRSGEGQVRVRKVRFGPEQYPIFGFHHHPPPPPPPVTFPWLLRGLDKSDGLRMGWYDSSVVRGGYNFKVDFKVDIKGDLRGHFREYFMEL